MATDTLMKHGVVLVTLAVLQIKASGVVLDLLRVESDIEHRYAVTQVTAAYVNTQNSSEEISLRMTLPKDAYVSSLVIDVGGKNHSTVVAEKERVKRTGPKPPPQGGKNRHQRRGSNTQKFRASSKVRALQTVIFYLTYEQLLVRRHGSYMYNLHLGIAKFIANVEVKVRLFETEEIKEFQIVRLPWMPSWTPDSNTTEAETVTNSPGEITASFRMQNVTILGVRRETTATDEDAEEGDDVEGDPSTFSVSYDVDRETDGGEIQILGQFFVHRFSPEGLPKLPTHTVFVLDVSGSMHDNGKLTQLKVAMRAILTTLPPEDSFEILVFSTRVTSLGVFQAVPEEVEKSLSRIQRLQALGGTNFNEAFLKALQDVNNFNLTSGAKQVVFLTDGRPNLGEKKPSQLRRNVREANIHHLPIHSLGFGHDADMRLLRQVSTDNQGFTGKIDEDAQPAKQFKSFYDKIASPLMTDIEIMYMDDEVDTSSVVRQGPSTFYAGDEMVMAGQLKEGVKEVQPLVTGQGNEGPLQFRVSRVSTPEKVVERDNYVERLWAYLTVKDLLEMQDVVEDRNLKAEMNFRALEIALKFQFVTKLTSLEPEEEEEEEDDVDGEGGLGHKSASRYQKSNTGTLTLFYDHLALLSEAEFAKTLPAPLSTRLNTASNNRFSFGDNDPHFVVQVSGMEMPFCFDIHGQHGQVLSLVRDENSGIIVNGLVTSAVGRPDATYFTELFIGLGKVNFTITPHNISITFLQGHRNSKIPRVLRSVWPFRKMYRRGRKGQDGRKSRRHSKGRTRRERRSLTTSRTDGTDGLTGVQSTRAKEYRQYRDSTHHEELKAKPRRILRHGIMNDYNYNNQKRRGSIVMRNLGSVEGNHLLISRMVCPNLKHKRNKKDRKIRRRRLADENQRYATRNNWKKKSTSSKIIKSVRVKKGPSQIPLQVSVISAYPHNKTLLLDRRQNPQNKRIGKRRRMKKSIKVRRKRNAFLRKILDTIHPHARKDERSRQAYRNHNGIQRYRPHPHVHAFHGTIPTSRRSDVARGQESHAVNTFTPLSATSKLFRGEMEIHGSEVATDASTRSETSRLTATVTPSSISYHQQKASRIDFTPTTIATTTDGPKEWLESPAKIQRNSSEERRIIHPHLRGNVSVFSLQQIIRQSEKGNPPNLHQPKADHTTETIRSRNWTSSSLHQSPSKSISEHIHPHSHAFRLTTEASVSERASTIVQNYQSGVTVHPNLQQELQESEHYIPVVEEHFDGVHSSGEHRKRQPKKTFSWRRAAGRRYGDVVVALKNRKKLEVLIGDVDIHLVVTRSKTKYGQDFLGFYVEEHNILSPNTTGIIGQFAYKTVGTMTPTDGHLQEGRVETRMKVAVLHQGANMQYRVSEVSGMVSKRRSMLHKSHVNCLLVPNQGEGLVAGSPEDYFLPCLTC